MPLEDFFCGDDDFRRFALACESEWAKCACQSELLHEVGGDLDLAIALHFHHGANALGWLDQTVPALEGRTPRECLKFRAGRHRLKECLLRMH